LGTEVGLIKTKKLYYMRLANKQDEVNHKLSLSQTLL